jgi:hypothetical protein
MNNFQLQPFATNDQLPAIEISGMVNRQDGFLAIEYQLVGDLTSLAIPVPAADPTRKFHLWEATCFEFFVGIPGDRNYWEFNLAPAGDWNIFHLDDYRQGLKDEAAFTSLPFRVEQQQNSFSLALEFNLDRIIARQQPIEVSVTTVIQSVQGEMSYWALTHNGTEADFHRRDGFIISWKGEQLGLEF